MLIAIIALITLAYIGIQPTRLAHDLHERIRQIAYELRFSIVSTKKASSKIIIVQIDDRSYPAHLPKYPVDRAFIADLIHALNTAAPLAIGVNIVLDQKTTPENDQKLHQAIIEAGNVVLRSSRQYGLLDLFAKSAYASGAQIWGFDTSNTLQRTCNIPASCNATGLFHQKLGQIVAPGINEENEDVQPDQMEINFELYNAAGMNSRTFSASDIHQIPKELLHGSLVLIGTDFNGLSRRFKTPLYQKGDQLMGEIFVIDQLLQNRISGRSIHKVHPFQLILVMVTLMLLAALPAYYRRYTLFTVTSVLIILLWTAVSTFMFASFGVDIPFALPVAAFSVFYLLSIRSLLNHERLINLQQALELEQRRSLLQSAKLEHLSNQLNTHSLFNEFSRIRGLISIDPNKAREYLVHFTNMLKYSLLYSDKETVALENQIEFIRFYIDQQKATGNGIQFDFELTGDIDNIHLPWNSLFVLVENAVKHTETVLSENPAPTINIRLQIQNDRLLFKINNLFNCAKKIHSTKTGLKNLKNRLSILYGEENYKLELSHKSNLWTSRLDIPVSTSAATLQSS